MVSVCLPPKNHLRIHLRLASSCIHQQDLPPAPFSVSFPSGATLPPLPPALRIPARHRDCSSQPWHNGSLPDSPRRKGHIPFSRLSLPHTASAHHGISGRELLRRPLRMAVIPADSHLCHSLIILKEPLFSSYPSRLSKVPFQSDHEAPNDHGMLISSVHGIQTHFVPLIFTL